MCHHEWPHWTGHSHIKAWGHQLRAAAEKAYCTSGQSISHFRYGIVYTESVKCPRRWQKVWRNLVQLNLSLKAGIWPTRCPSNPHSQTNKKEQSLNKHTCFPSPSSILKGELFFQRVLVWSVILKLNVRSRRTTPAYCRHVLWVWWFQTTDKEEMTHANYSKSTSRHHMEIKWDSLGKQPCHKQSHLRSKPARGPSSPSPPCRHCPKQKFSYSAGEFWAGNGTSWDAWHNSDQLSEHSAKTTEADQTFLPLLHLLKQWKGCAIRI